MSVLGGGPDKVTSPLCTALEDDPPEEIVTSKVHVAQDNPCSSWKSVSISIRQHLCCPAACYTKLCTYCTYLFLSTLFLAGVILLICFGVFLVAPYRRSLRYIPTTCRVQFSNYTHSRPECFCGDGCVLSYKCLVVYGYHDVFDDNDEVQERVHTIIYDKQKDMERQMCTFHPECETSVMDSQVEAYRRRWGKHGKEFVCFSDPDDPSLVFRDREESDERVLEAMLVPSVMLLVALMGLFIKCKGLDWCADVMEKFICSRCMDDDDDKEDKEEKIEQEYEGSAPFQVDTEPYDGPYEGLS